GADSPEVAGLAAAHAAREEVLAAEYAELEAQVLEIRAEMARYRIEIRAPGGQIIPENRAQPDVPMQIAQVVRAFPANQLGFAGKAGGYFSRRREDHREGA